MIENDETLNDNTNQTEELTAKKRQMLVSLLSDYDSEKFVELQGKAAVDTVKMIENKAPAFEKQANSDVEKMLKDWMNQHPNQKLSLEQIEQYSKLAQKKQEDYRKRYANNLCGMGNGTLSYCIGLQRHSCMQANRELGYKVMPDIGFSCANARAAFTKQNIGQYHAKIGDCYDSKTNKVKYDENGKPKLQDGDLMLMVDPKDNQAYHCIRINVSKEGDVSYTAGNGEKVNGRLGWCKNEACYIIPTNEVAKNRANTYYNTLDNQQLIEAAQKRGLLEHPQLQEIQPKPYPLQTEAPDLEVQKLSENMSSAHSAISERIAAFRARRDSESVARADILTSMRADNLRLQQKRQSLAEMTGQNVAASPLSFAEKHFHCEDIAARLQTAPNENSSENTQTTERKNSFQRINMFSQSEYA